jgi:uncharacterized membrane protein
MFKYIVAFLVSAFALPVFAAPQAAIDVTDVTGTLSNQLTSISAVGLGILVLAALITAIAFVRRAVSGR